MKFQDKCVHVFTGISEPLVLEDEEKYFSKCIPPQLWNMPSNLLWWYRERQTVFFRVWIKHAWGVAADNIYMYICIYKIGEDLRVHLLENKKIDPSDTFTSLKGCK